MDSTFKITLIGFGNQAKAWALNLRDSGCQVFIGLRAGSASQPLAEQLGFATFDYTKSPITTSYCALLTPDDTHKEVLIHLSQHNKNISILLAHGYSQASTKLNETFSDFNFLLLAPKAIASEMRFRFETNQPLTGFYSLELDQKESFNNLKEIAIKLGLRNLYQTTFQEETQADLFSEQSLLCSLIPYSLAESFNTLVNKGYSKEIAFYECFFESKLIVDTLLKVGPHKFFDMISPNALIGSEKGRKLFIDQEFKDKLDQLLKNIEDKDFYQEIDQADIHKLRKDVSLYWQDQPLTKTYEELKETL